MIRMKQTFTKMHALGNDFMVIASLDAPFMAHPTTIKVWSDRHRGIGFDQLLVLEASPTSDADFVYRIFNADGSEVGQCGNGARCMARFIRDNHLSDKSTICLKTKTTLMSVDYLPDELYRVNFGVPHFKSIQSLFMINDVPYFINSVDVGNPHAVLVVTDTNSVNIHEIGPEIETHPAFPEGTNVEFMEIIAPDYVDLRVWERGVGETQACGSGALAAACYGMAQCKLDKLVKVHLPGGIVQVEWVGENEPAYLIGNAISVYSGEIK